MATAPDHGAIPKGDGAAHPLGYVQETDAGAIGADRPFTHTNQAAGYAEIKTRNATNSAYLGANASFLGGAPAADYATKAYADAAASGAAPAFVALIDAATITWATAGKSVSNATVILGGNRTLDITGAVNGASGELRVTQDGTGGRTLTLPVGSKVVNGPLALASGAGTLTILAWSYDGTTFVFTYGAAV